MFDSPFCSAWLLCSKSSWYFLFLVSLCRERRLNNNRLLFCVCRRDLWLLSLGFSFVSLSPCLPVLVLVFLFKEGFQPADMSHWLTHSLCDCNEKRDWAVRWRRPPLPTDFCPLSASFSPCFHLLGSVADGGWVVMWCYNTQGFSAGHAW